MRTTAALMAAAVAGSGISTDESKTEIPPKTLTDLVNVLERMNNKETKVHQKALDDLVNVNNLFTIAVFIGWSFSAPNQKSLEARPECDAGPGIAKTLVVFQVASFACFLLSSLVAKSIKVVLNIGKKHSDRDNPMIPDRLFKRWLLSDNWMRFLMVLSIAASIVGIWFLTFSMFNVIQIRVGKLNCGSTYTLSAVIPLLVIVLASQVIYLPSMMYAVFVTAPASDKCDDDKKSQA